MLPLTSGDATGSAELRRLLEDVDMSTDGYR
jgi:hypothetical protein